MMMPIQVEEHRTELLYCGSCRNNFQARIVTWVDIARTPGVKTLLQKWEFNLITCPNCGNRQFSDSQFFYEDLEEGLLVAVFPSIPVNRLSVEAEIRKKYSYYPTLEFFYDMTQLWFLIYLQEHYKRNKNPCTIAKIGRGDKRLQTFLRFLKKDPLMLAIRETLTATLMGNKTSDDLQNVLWRALAKLEGVSSGPSDASHSVKQMTI
jgi:hypothetical protein